MTKLQAILSKLLLLVLVPFVFLAAVISDIIGLEPVEK